MFTVKKETEIKFEVGNRCQTTKNVTVILKKYVGGEKIKLS